MNSAEIVFEGFITPKITQAILESLKDAKIPESDKAIYQERVGSLTNRKGRILWVALG